MQQQQQQQQQLVLCACFFFGRCSTFSLTQVVAGAVKFSHSSFVHVFSKQQFRVVLQLQAL